MWLQLVNVLYVLVAIAMIGLILMQRGAGAQAGSGFGGGASATVFGARGSANFLSKSTAILSGVFFAMSLGMAIYLHKTTSSASDSDLGVMSSVAPPAPTAEVPAVAPGGEVPAAPASEAPASEVPSETATPAVDPATPVEAPKPAPEG